MKKLFAVIAAVAVACPAYGQSLEGSFPAEGGAITVTSVGGPVRAAGLDLQSSNAGLVPAGDAAPFTFLLSDTASQITYGNLGSNVTIDGALTLTAGATAGAEIAASWGDGATPVAFPVAAAGGEPVPPVVLTGDMLFSPADAIWGGQSDGTTFSIGAEGTSGDTNNWPGGEPPAAIIDGQGQKYLNFGKVNTGVVITPAAGSSVVSGLKFFAANDSPERDPSGYQIWGSNADVSTGAVDLSAFTAISVGDLSLPESRNDGGDAALDDANSFSVAFDNSDAYASYLLIFPDIKDNAAANSMQIAEVQAFGAVVPEPSSAIMGLGLLMLLPLVRRRRK